MSTRCVRGGSEEVVARRGIEASSADEVAERGGLKQLPTEHWPVQPDQPWDVTGKLVLHVGKYLTPFTGGVESVTEQMMDFAGNAGMRAHALVHHHQFFKRDDSWAGPHRVLRSPILGRLVFTPLAPLFWLDLQRMLALEPDLLHIHMPNMSAFWCLMSTRARKIPWIVHWHADVVVPGAPQALKIAYRGYRPLEQAVLKQAQRIIVTNPRVSEESSALRRWLSKCAVVPLTVPDISITGQRQRLKEDTPRTRQSGQPLRILTVARLSVFKGHLAMLDHLARLKASGIRFHWDVVGDGDQRQAIVANITRLGLDDDITLHGTLTGSVLEQAFTACDVFVLPSISALESFGIVLLEAMRAGKPCVVHDIAGSGMAWVVQHGKTGVVVPLNDSTHWIDTLTDAAHNPSVWREYGKAGRRRYEESFTPARVEALWLAQYGTVVSTMGMQRGQ